MFVILLKPYVSENKIKFCTCVADDVELDELDHFWVLHRYNNGEIYQVIGEPIIPDDQVPSIVKPYEELNQEVIKLKNKNLTFLINNSMISIKIC